MANMIHRHLSYLGGEISLRESLNGFLPQLPPKPMATARTVRLGCAPVCAAHRGFRLTQPQYEIE